MPPVATSRLIGPVLAGTAALFAGGVWLLPQRLFTPELAAPAPIAPPGSVKPAYVPPPKETRWPELASKLEALRDPWKGPDSAVATNPEQPQAQPEVTLSWEYVGLVDAGQFRAAIVVVNNVQRFVSVGEGVTDPSFPGVTLRIKAIEEDKLEVEHETGGTVGQVKPRVSTVQRKKPQPPAITASASVGGVSPKGAMPVTPGLTTGGGRGVVNAPSRDPRPKPVNPPPGTAFPINPPGGGATPAPVSPSPGQLNPNNPFSRPIVPSAPPAGSSPNAPASQPPASQPPASQPPP